MFGKILRAYRKNNKKSQKEIADILEISRNYVSLIERDLANNISYCLASKILNLDSMHHQIEVTLTRRVNIDAAIAAEIVWLNAVGVITEGSCQGPPATALIKPSSVDRAQKLGYVSSYQADTGLFEISLKSKELD